MNFPKNVSSLLDEALGEYRALERSLATALAGTGLTVDAWRVLRVLRRLRAASMKEILESTHLPPASATRAVDILVSLDFAFRRSDELDRRSVQVLVTDAGSRVLSHLDNRLSTAFESRFSSP